MKDPEFAANWAETEELMQVPDKGSSSSSRPAKTIEFYAMAEGNEDSQYDDSQYILD